MTALRTKAVAGPQSQGLAFYIDSPDDRDFAEEHASPVGIWPSKHHMLKICSNSV